MRVRGKTQEKGLVTKGNLTKVSSRADTDCFSMALHKCAKEPSISPDSVPQPAAGHPLSLERETGGFLLLLAFAQAGSYLQGCLRPFLGGKAKKAQPKSGLSFPPQHREEQGSAGLVQIPPTAGSGGGWG